MFLNVEIIVIKHLEAAIRHETLGNAYAFWCLVVLDNGSDYARQRKSRPVERMAQFGFLGLAVTVTAFQTVCLIALEV